MTEILSRDIFIYLQAYRGISWNSEFLALETDQVQKIFIFREKLVVHFSSLIHLQRELKELGKISGNLKMIGIVRAKVNHLANGALTLGREVDSKVIASTHSCKRNPALISVL